MKSYLIVSFCLLFISATYAQSLPGWRLIWQDEFNGPSLDFSKWDVEVNCWGGGNDEKQCYVNSTRNIYIENGVLNIRAIAETYTGSPNGCNVNVDNACARTMPATSGRIRTLKPNNVGSWKYGRFEIRAQMPEGDFLWPAIWMLPTDNAYGAWAASGDINIAEFAGQRTSVVGHSIHFGGEWPRQVYSGVTKTYPFDLTKGFHTYALEWDENELRFYVDNTLGHSERLNRSFGSIYKSNGQPFDQNFHLIINMAVGGNFFGPEFGNFDINKAAATWRSPFKIDYVRVYEAAPYSVPVEDGDDDCVDSYTLTASADSYINQQKDSANENFATDKILTVKYDSNSERIAFVQFDLEENIPSEALLRVYGFVDSSKKQSVQVALYSVKSFDEAQITWNKSPAVPSAVIATQSVSTPAWYTFNVTKQVVDAFKSNASTVSFAIKVRPGLLSADAAVLLHSREHSKNKPVLDLSFE